MGDPRLDVKATIDLPTAWGEAVSVGAPYEFRVGGSVVASGVVSSAIADVTGLHLGLSAPLPL